MSVIPWQKVILPGMVDKQTQVTESPSHRFKETVQKAGPINWVFLVNKLLQVSSVILTFQPYRHRKTCEFLLPKIFLLFLEKNPPNPEIRDNPHGHQQWWPSTPSPPKALWQAVQLPLQQKNYQVPNLHTVVASLRTVVHPPPLWPYSPFIITPADRVQSDLTLYVLALSRTRINKKTRFFNERL